MKQKNILILAITALFSMTSLAAEEKVPSLEKIVTPAPAVQTNTPPATPSPAVAPVVVSPADKVAAQPAPASNKPATPETATDKNTIPMDMKK